MSCIILANFWWCHTNTVMNLAELHWRFSVVRCESQTTYALSVADWVEWCDQSHDPSLHRCSQATWVLASCISWVWDSGWAYSNYQKTKEWIATVSKAKPPRCAAVEIWLRKYTHHGQEASNPTVSHGLATPLWTVAGVHVTQSIIGWCDVWLWLSLSYTGAEDSLLHWLWRTTGLDQRHTTIVWGDGLCPNWVCGSFGCCVSQSITMHHREASHGAVCQAGGCDGSVSQSGARTSVSQGWIENPCVWLITIGY